MARRQLPLARIIPNDDSIARYCDPVNIDLNGRPTGAAFQPRVVDHGKLSTDWVECLSGPPLLTQIAAVRASLAAHVGGYKADGKIAIVQVRNIRAIKVETEALDVVHAPTRNNACHAAITGVSGIMELPFAELLADLAAGNLIQAGGVIA